MGVTGVDDITGSSMPGMGGQQDYQDSSGKSPKKLQEEKDLAAALALVNSKTRRVSWDLPSCSYKAAVRNLEEFGLGPAIYGRAGESLGVARELWGEAVRAALFKKALLKWKEARKAARKSSKKGDKNQGGDVEALMCKDKEGKPEGSSATVTGGVGGEENTMGDTNTMGDFSSSNAGANKVLKPDEIDEQAFQEALFSKCRAPAVEVAIPLTQQQQQE